MMNARILLKDKTEIVVNGVNTIHVAAPNHKMTFSRNEFEKVALNPSCSYSFVSSSEIVSVSGADIYYVRIIKD